MIDNDVFYSKILLFGEYSVLKKSMALAIPYDKFGGQLDFPSENEKGWERSYQELVTFADYVEREQKTSHILGHFNLSIMREELKNKIFFRSTIPEGRGLGSSGALVAALYHRYGGGAKLKRAVSAYQLEVLRAELALLENYFHQKSSGIDPLLSYCARPMLSDSNQQLSLVGLMRFSGGRGAIFLIDTKISRKTAPLVKMFLERLEDKSTELDYYCDHYLKPLTNLCIAYFLDGDFKRLMHEFKQLSLFQLQHFDFLIPEKGFNYKELWQEGLESDSFYLKLCGAGAGGCLIGITSNLEKALPKLKGQDVQVILNFTF